MYARSSQQSETLSPAFASQSEVATGEPWMDQATAPGGGNSMAVASMGSTGGVTASNAEGGEIESPDWAADVDGESQAAGVGESVMAAAVAVVDGMVPAGMGLKVGGELEVSLLLLVGAAGGIMTLTNAGDGWVTLKVEWDGGFGIGGGIGESLLGEELEGSARGMLKAAGSITCLVPWVSLAGVDLLGQLAACGSIGEVTDVLGQFLADLSLGAYVVETEGSAALEAGIDLEASDGLDEADAEALTSYGVGFTISWDVEETKAGGARTGLLVLEGTMESLIAASANLPWLACLDLTLWEADARLAVEIPQMQAEDGTVTHGTPSVLNGVGLGGGGVKLGGEQSHGGNNTTTLTASVDGGNLVMKAGTWIAAEMGGLPGDWSVGGELALEIDWDPIRGAAADAGTKVAAWLLGTGPQPAAADLGGQSIDALIAAADLSLEIEAESELWKDEAGLEGGEGVQLGGEAGGSAALVYASDDILPEIGRPAPAEVVGALSGSAPA